MRRISVKLSQIKENKGEIAIKISKFEKVSRYYIDETASYTALIVQRKLVESGADIVSELSKDASQQGESIQ